jgi:hypothetical protein
MYESFYDCMVDLGNTLGISNVEDLDIAIKFMDQSGFTEMADYLRQQSLRFAWQQRREWEKDNGDIGGTVPC